MRPDPEPTKAWISRFYDYVETLKGPVAPQIRFAASLLLARGLAGAGRTRDYDLLKYLNAKLNESEFALGRTRLYSMPTLLRVGATRRCNLRCITCGVGHRTAEEERHYRAEGRMDLDVRDYNLVAQGLFPYLKEIQFSQNGEAFVLGDRFFSMLAEADARRVGITISTNGMVLDRGSIQKLLGLSHLRWVTFSLDGSTKQTLERVRVGASFERIVDTIRLLAAMRPGPDRPALRIHFTATRSNLEELPAVVDLASQLGVQEVSVAYVYVNPHVPLGESLYFAKEQANRVIAAAANRAAERGVRFAGPPPFGRKTAGGFRCPSPWNGPSLVPGGYLMPCCVLYRKDHFMGHAGEGFERVWNNTRYRRLRRALVARKPFIEKCRYCNLHPEGFDPDRLPFHVTEELLDTVLRSAVAAGWGRRPLFPAGPIGGHCARSEGARSFISGSPCVVSQDD